MNTTTLAICMTFLMTVISGAPSLVLAESDMGQVSDSEQEAGPVEIEQVVEFDREMHFLSKEGTDIALPAGSYYVDPVQDGIRFKSADQEEAEAVIVEAETTTHEQTVEAPESVSIKEGDDQQVVLILMPEGKGLQAVGTISGIQSRGRMFRATKLAPKTLGFLPKVKGIFTTPKLGSLTPGGTLYIKGDHFGSSKGKVNLHLSYPVKKMSPCLWCRGRIRRLKPKFLRTFPESWIIGQKSRCGQEKELVEWLGKPAFMPLEPRKHSKQAIRP